MRGLGSGVGDTKGQDPRGMLKKELEVVFTPPPVVFTEGGAGVGVSPQEGRASEPLSRQCW